MNALKSKRAEELPQPPVPRECDLNHLSAVTLDVAGLLESDLLTLEDAEPFRVLVNALCRAWHRVPAGSLPSDERRLAQLLGYGRDLAAWRPVAEIALADWYEASDGRLYHEGLAKTVLKAWDAYQAAQHRGHAGARKRWREGGALRTAPSRSVPAAPAFAMENEFEPVRPGIQVDPKSRLVAAKMSRQQEQAARQNMPGMMSSPPRTPVIAPPVVVPSTHHVTAGPEVMAPDQRAQAIKAIVPYLPGDDDNERWSLALAAENPQSQNYQEAVEYMIQGAELAGVRWTEPMRDEELK